MPQHQSYLSVATKDEHSAISTLSSTIDKLEAELSHLRAKRMMLVRKLKNRKQVQTKKANPND